MKPESIIRVVRDREKGHYDRRIDTLTGHRYTTRPTFYENLETGEKYYHIAGAIAFSIQRAPGFAVVLAVMMDPVHKQYPQLKVLAEVEDHDLVGLLSQCERIRYRFGYPHCLDMWIGVEMYLEAIAAFNDDIEATPDDRRQGVLFSPPFDHEDIQRRNAIYLETVRRLLTPGPNGKRLLIGNSPKLRAHLQNVPPDLKHVDEIPALAALAFATHTVLSERPWMEFATHRRYEATIADGFQQVDLNEPLDLDLLAYGERHDEDEDSYDDGNLVGTIEV